MNSRFQEDTQKLHKRLDGVTIETTFLLKTLRGLVASDDSPNLEFLLLLQSMVEVLLAARF